jgi:hypothetical protein
MAIAAGTVAAIFSHLRRSPGSAKMHLVFVCLFV